MSQLENRLGRAAAALALLLAAAPARPAPADPAPAPAGRRDVGFLLRMNLDFGGDKVVDVPFSDGSKATLRAGQLFTFAAGAIYHPDAPWALEATVGYKFDKANGSNGTIEFTRVPFDVIASWVPAGGHRLGAGATVHLAPTYNCDASGVCSEKVTFDPAVGGILQYAYGFRVGANGGLDLGARYTFISYHKSGVQSLDGSGIGLFFGGWL